MKIDPPFERLSCRSGKARPEDRDLLKNAPYGSAEETCAPVRGISALPGTSGRTHSGSFLIRAKKQAPGGPEPKRGGVYD